MKTLQFFAIIFMILLSALSFAQCNPSIPNFAQVVNSNGVNSDEFSDYWVCENINANFSGGANNIYVEAHDSIYITNDGSTIHIKGPGFIRLTGDDNDVFAEANVVVEDLGAIGNAVTTCALTFTYTSAPAPGCFPTGIAKESEAISFISMFPNPASGELKFNISNQKSDWECLIFDSMGKNVKQLIINPGQGAINISDLQEGIYSFKIIAGEQVFTKRIQVY